MPLVTSSSVQGNLYRQATSPSTAQTGDIWVDTDNGQVFTYNGAAWVQQSGGALGTALQRLSVNSGATALEYSTVNFWTLLATVAGAGSSDLLDSGVITSYDNYMVIVRKGSAANINSGLRFNADSGNNYNSNTVESVTNNAFSGISYLPCLSGTTTGVFYCVWLVRNKPTTLKKLVTKYGHTGTNTSLLGSGEWTNATAAITRIQAYAGVAVNFESTDSMLVFGMNDPA